jgi:hypothetical protein
MRDLLFLRLFFTVVAVCRKGSLPFFVDLFQVFCKNADISAERRPCAGQTCNYYWA